MKSYLLYFAFFLFSVSLCMEENTQFEMEYQPQPNQGNINTQTVQVPQNQNVQVPQNQNAQVPQNQNAQVPQNQAQTAVPNQKVQVPQNKTQATPKNETQQEKEKKEKQQETEKKEKKEQQEQQQEVVQQETYYYYYPSSYVLEPVYYASTPVYYSYPTYYTVPTYYTCYDELLYYEQPDTVVDVYYRKNGNNAEFDTAKAESALKKMKKEIFNNENMNMEEYRKNNKVYDRNWLKAQARISRVMFLEQRIKELESPKNK